MYCLAPKEERKVYSCFCDFPFGPDSVTNERVVKLKVVESKEETGYYGWWSNLKKRFTFVNANKNVLESLNFPFGIAEAEKSGRGMLMNVKIVMEGKK
jgi:hypothetical protein